MEVRISKKFIVLVILGLAAAGFIVFLFRSRFWSRLGKSSAELPEVKVLDYQDERAKIKLKYLEGFVIGQLSSQGKVSAQDEQILLKLVRVDPPTLVLGWAEPLGVVEAFMKKPLLQYLRDNIDRRYGSEYKDFKKEKVEDATLGGLPAFTVWFTFQDPKKTYREKIRLTVTVKESKGIYLQCMAPDVVWDFAEPSCDLIKTSFEFLP